MKSPLVFLLLALASLSTACLRLRGTFYLHDTLTVSLTDKGVQQCSYHGPYYGGWIQIPCMPGFEALIHNNRDTGDWTARYARNDGAGKKAFAFEIYSIPLLDKFIFRGVLRLFADNYGCTPAPI